jgi:23S rRNA pseudouridine2604 synthase
MTPPEPQRLSKVVAAQLPCSRSQAEQYIAEGWVRVDGVVVREPQFRVGTQRVEVDAQARLQAPVPVTLLVHKPAGARTDEAQALLDAQHHWEGDRSGIRRVKSHGVGLVALLPLPAQAAGLVVFSQNAGVIRKLREEGHLVEQELIVDVAGSIAPDGLQRLGGGLVFEGRPLPAARVSWQSETRLRIAAKGIAPHLVPWMCEQVGLRVTGLRRIRIGRVPMAGLPVGHWCHLPPGLRF